MLARALCGFFLIAVAAPPQPGLEVGANAGFGSYTSTGCDTPRIAYRETTYAANVRYRDPEGPVAAAVDVSIAAGRPTSGPGAPQRNYSVAFRGGGHWAYGGFELGLGAVKFDQGAGVVPSGLVWLGLPEFHAFSSLAVGRIAVGMPDFTIGLGHSSRYLALRAGAGAQGFVADAELRLFKHVGPVISVRARDPDWNVAFGAAFHFDQL